MPEALDFLVSLEGHRKTRGCREDRFGRHLGFPWAMDEIIKITPPTEMLQDAVFREFFGIPSPVM